MKKIAFLAVLAVLAFTSCDNFFGKSWGNQRSYDPSKISLNAGNLQDWIDRAVGDPDLAFAITQKIIQELGKGSLSPQERLAFQEAGVKLAANASGLSESLLTRAAAALGDGDNMGENTLKDILEKVQGDFNSGGKGPNAADNLSQLSNISLVNTPYSDNDEPRFSPEFEDQMNPEDVSEAILVLILGSLSDTNTSMDSFDNPDDWKDVSNLAQGLKMNEDGTVVLVDGGTTAPNDKALALAAYLNLVAHNQDKFSGNPLTDAINEAFFDSK